MAHRERLDRILQAGARVLSERGYYGATMRDVADAAGVSLGTLYHYVGGKDDLLYRVQHRILDGAVASAQAALAARGTQQRLKALLTDHIARVMARPAEASVLAGRLGPLRGERARRVEELRLAYLRLVRATADGAARRTTSRGRESEERALLLLGMADRLALDAAERRPMPRPSRLASRVLGVFLEGCRRRGR